MSCTHKLTAQKKHQTSTAPSSPAPARDPFAGTSFTWLVVFCSFWGGREDSEGHVGADDGTTTAVEMLQSHIEDHCCHSD